MKNIRLIILLGLLSACVPLSNDLYLPALPQMVRYFDTTEMALNSTLTVFYLFMALGMMGLGPLSDKMGRKALLIPCISVYSLASLACGLCTSVGMLVAMRAVQATAVGALVAISTAMVPDAFEGVLRERILGIVTAMSLIAPMVAPVLGAALLTWFSWQAEFFVLALFGFLALAFILMQPESLPKEKRLTGNVFTPLKKVGSLITDKSFFALMLVTGLPPLSYMAFISASSYIYQMQFGFSEVQYGLVYALNAVAIITGTLVSYRIRQALGGFKLISVFMLIMAAASVAIAATGWLHPILFFVLFLPFAFCCTGLKPVSFSLLLRQKESETGAASSVINFVHTITSCVGLILGSIAWGNMAMGLGAVMSVVGIGAFIAWLAMLKSPLIHLAALEDEEKGSH